MLEKTEGTITNEQYRDIGNFEYKEQEENKQNRKNNTTRKLDEQHGLIPLSWLNVVDKTS
jgi:hypothetical protein